MNKERKLQLPTGRDIPSLHDQLALALFIIYSINQHVDACSY